MGLRASTAAKEIEQRRQNAIDFELLAKERQLQKYNSSQLDDRVEEIYTLFLNKEAKHPVESDAKMKAISSSLLLLTHAGSSNDRRRVLV